MIYSLLTLALPMIVLSEIKGDEFVVFYATAAYQDAESGAWTVPMHGAIFEPEENSIKRRTLLSLMRRAIDLEKADEESAILRERISRFLVDNERGKQIIVQLGKRDVALGESTANGHFRGAVELTDDDVKLLLREFGSEDGWVTYRAIMRDGDDRTFTGRVQFVPAEGVSIISDIDDTVKISHVTDRAELLRNTFLRPAKAVPGMAAVYQKWAKDGAVFHYVSASPWQLYETLDEFRADADLPEGTFQLRNFRLKDSTAINLLTSSVKYKLNSIDRLLAACPRRKFILVGDSGENDPEIYAATYRKHAGRVQHIAIRNVTDAERSDARFTKAMQDIPDDKWQLFDKAAEMGFTID